VAASVYSRALQKAVELIGGQQNLCRYLRVPAGELQSWIEDKKLPPQGIFLRVVDFIIAETPAPGGSIDPEEPSAPRDCSAGGDSAATRY
jgi:hypothetical protein